MKRANEIEIPCLYPKEFIDKMPNGKFGLMFIPYPTSKEDKKAHCPMIFMIVSEEQYKKVENAFERDGYVNIRFLYSENGCFLDFLLPENL